MSKTAIEGKRRTGGIVCPEMEPPPHLSQNRHVTVAGRLSSSSAACHRSSSLSLSSQSSSESSGISSTGASPPVKAEIIIKR
ncbi:hypothetical protein EYF80_030822 [Liparis tanakae]|uniref:Uncharacterized protein n=1 Tax=Liparis tanakae TaxID=230148 RepID=A0A4Z2GZJ5_9TELE|nr:hypothetical protein EYF80_030822 [Liparis tanakae]